MHQFFKDGGFLTEAGKQFLHKFSKELNALLSDQVVESMNQAELQVLGSNLANLVGNKISETLLKK